MPFVRVRRRGLVCAGVLFVVLISVGLASGCGKGSGREEALAQPPARALELRRVLWPAIRGNSIGQIETDADRTWVLTIVPVPLDDGNVFSLDPASLAVRGVAAKVPFAQIFAGEGQLWGLPEDGGIVFVNPSTGGLESHGLPRDCGVAPDVAGVVRLGQLWLSCRGVVDAYKPKRSRVEHFRAPRSSTVLGSTRGVWLLARRSLVGVAGDARGRRIALQRAHDLSRWQAEGDEAWALDIGSNGNALVRVDLASGAVRRFALEARGRRIDTFAVGSHDIWVTLADAHTLQAKPLLLRFDRTQPRRPLSRLDLSDAAHSHDFEIFLTPGPSYLWVDLFASRQSHLFRVTVRR